MRRISTVAILISLVAATARAGEMGRAVWVVRDRLESSALVEETCLGAKEAGFDTLVVQIRGRGDAYYRSTLAPKAERLAQAPEGFDPFSEVLAKAACLRVLAWLNAYFVWGGDAPPQDPSHIVNSGADWLLRDYEGRRVSDYTPFERSLGLVEGAYADPASEGYRRLFSDVAKEVVTQYPVQGIHLDFVRYPGAAYGHNAELDGQFEDRWGFGPQWIPLGLRTPDLRAWLSGEMPLADRVLTTAALFWADLRASQITALVRAVRAAMDAVRPGLELSAAVFPDAWDAYLKRGQDWTSWASEGLVDALHPMAYVGNADRVGNQLRVMRDLIRPRAPKTRLWAGLGSYQKGVEAIGAEARIARDLGFDGVCLFDLGSAVKAAPGLKAYAQAIQLPSALSEPRAVPPVLTGPAPSLDPGARALAEIVARAVNAGAAPSQGWEGLVRARWEEFAAARVSAIPAALAKLREKPLTVPPWVEAKGILRHVHAQDGPDRRGAQRQECEAALGRLRKGEPWELVAKEQSHGPTRAFGGSLGRRYLWPQNHTDQMLLGLKPGVIGPVVEVPEGFWIYSVDRKGGGETIACDEAPWAVKQAAIRRELHSILDKAADPSKVEPVRPAGTVPEG